MKNKVLSIMLVTCLFFTTMLIPAFATEGIQANGVAGETGETGVVCTECSEPDGGHLESCSRYEQQESALDPTLEPTTEPESSESESASDLKSGESTMNDGDTPVAECTCDAAEGDVHAKDCLLYEVQSGETEEISAGASENAQQLNAGLSDFKQFEVQSNDPANVTLNLFDYWLSDNEIDRFADDINESDRIEAGTWGKYGINEDHLLRFRKAASYVLDDENVVFKDYNSAQRENYEDKKILSGGLNHGTSQGEVTNKADEETIHWIVRPRQGIVQSTLGEDGYPRLAYQEPAGNEVAVTDDLDSSDPNYSPQMFLGFSPTEAQKNESLSYLFDPTVKHDGKASFADVKGLFQQDHEGYYYYNSTGEAHDGYIDSTHAYDDEDGNVNANYAYFDEDENKFRLYNTYGVDSNEGLGQFFPFDSPENVFDINDGNLQHKTDNSGDKVSGIRVNAFGAGENGTTYTFNHYFGISMEIPFIQPIGGKTSYAGKEQDTTFHFSGDDDLWLFVDDVLVGDVGGIHGISTLDINFATGEVVVNDDERDEQGNVTTNVPGTQKTSLKEIYQAANATLDENNADAGTYADGSSHTIRVFYMERGNSASNLGIKFNLSNIPVSKIIKYDEDGNTLEGAVFELYEADENYNIKNDVPIFEGTSDENGEIHLVNPEDDAQPIVIGSLPGDHFILRETKVPAGYRSSGDMHLRKHKLGDGSVVLISDPESPTGSKWNTGSYAAAVETTRTSSNTVNLRNDGNDS